MPVLTLASQKWPVLVACLLLAGGALLATSQVSAQGPSGWSTPATIGLSTTAIRFSNIANDGENLAVLSVAPSGSNPNRLSTYDATTHVWTTHAAITTPNCSSTGYGVIRLAHGATSTWVYQGEIPASNVYQTCRTADNGATWTAVRNGGTAGTGYTGQLLYSGGVFYSIWSGANALRFSYSLDDGVTWSSDVIISDNAAGPSETPTVAINPSAAAMAIHDGTIYVVFVKATGGKFFQVTASVSDPTYWDQPYTVDLGTTENPTYTDAQQVQDLYFRGDLMTWVRSTGTGSANFNPVSADILGGHLTNIGSCSQRVDQGFGGVEAAQPIFAENPLGTIVGAISCGNPVGFGIYYQLGGSFAFTQATTSIPSTVHPNAFTLGMTPTKTWVIYTNDPTTGQALAVSALTPSTSPLTSVASTSVTNLQGFQVDPFDQVVVARTDVASGVSKIRTFDASSPSLAQRGASPITTACGQTDGVMAYSTTANGKQYAGFVDCNGSNVVSSFGIRGGDLNSPNQQGTACEGVSICDLDMDGSNISGTGSNCDGKQLPDGSLNMGSVAAIPISWETGSQSGINHVEVGFAYSNTANGNIGVWAIRQQTGPDESCRVEFPFSAPGNTYQICSWRNTVDNQDYIAAAGPVNPTKAWRFTLDSFSLSDELNVRMDAVAAGLSAPYDHLRAIACTQNDAVVMQATSGQVSRIHLVGGGIGGVVWGPIPGPSGSVVQRGTAISRDGKWAAIASDTNIEVLDGLTGAVLSTIPTPGGQFKDMYLDDTGQTLWVGTTTSINEYDVHSLTTVTSVPVGTSMNGTVCRNGANEVIPCTGPTTIPSVTFTGTGNQAFAAHAAGEAFGGGDAGGGLIVSIIYILGFGAVGSAVMAEEKDGKSKPNLAGFVVGAVLGFAYSVYSSLIPGIITFLLVAVCAGLVTMKFMGRASGGGDG